MSPFNTLAILFSTVGNYMTDRVFGIRDALCLNAPVLPIVYTVLSIPGLGTPGHVFLMRLLLFGGMVSGKALSSLTDRMYAKDDERRDGVSAIAYVISNTGAMIPSAMDTIALTNDHHAVFVLCAMVSTLGSTLYLILERAMFGPTGAEPDGLLPSKVRKTTITVVFGITTVVTVALVLPFMQGILTAKSSSSMVSTISLFTPFGYLVCILMSSET